MKKMGVNKILNWEQNTRLWHYDSRAYAEICTWPWGWCQQPWTNLQKQYGEIWEWTKSWFENKINDFYFHKSSISLASSSEDSAQSLWHFDSEHLQKSVHGLEFFLHLQANVLHWETSQLQLILFKTESGAGRAFGGIITAAKVADLVSIFQPN